MVTVRLTLLLLLLIVWGRGRRHLREEEKRLLLAAATDRCSAWAQEALLPSPAQAFGLPDHILVL
jgi:hypothetical protein